MVHVTLVERRKKLGLSQAALALELGISQAAVSRAENEDRSDKRYALSLEALELRGKLSLPARKGARKERASC